MGLYNFRVFTMWFLLDRDGVINQDSDNFVRNAEQWIPLPGSIDAMARLLHAGHHVIVCTNQSGIGRRLFTEDDLAAMHNKLTDLLAQKSARLDHIYYCPHHPDDGCECRKPKAGMLKQAAVDFSFSATDAVMIGDSKRDLDAGVEFGCKIVLVKTGKGMKTLSQLKSENSVFLNSAAIYPDLSAYVDCFLNI
jgi:D-glycero-D-manno-heptose 1,7-bisphosphate phosphatase